MNTISPSDSYRPRTHLFMVRLWMEDLGEGKTEWRGRVHAVDNGELRYFRDWQTLITYLQTLAKVNAEDS